MKFLITNSDDFGLTQSVTDAIIDTHIHGIMKSTTIMVNMEGTDYAINKAKEISTLAVGIHFNLTEGKPLTDPHKIPDLLAEDGCFKKNREQRKNFIWGKEKQKQAELELNNQLVYLLDNGYVPTHFDSHHHITGTPIAFKASINVAKRYKINRTRITNINFWYLQDFNNQITKARHQLSVFPKMIIHNNNKRLLLKNGFITPNYKVLPSRVFPTSSDYLKQFINALSILKEGVTEISFHPGYENSYVKDSKATAQIRLRDLAIAKSPEVIEYIKRNNIQLINFRDLAIS